MDERFSLADISPAAMDFVLSLEKTTKLTDADIMRIHSYDVEKPGFGDFAVAWLQSRGFTDAPRRLAELEEDVRRAAEEITSEKADVVEQSNAICLAVNQKGVPLQTVNNHAAVLEQDAAFAGKIAFDEFSRRIVLRGGVPWDAENVLRPWSSSDDAAAFAYIQGQYGLKSREDFRDAVDVVAMRGRFHPVREFLEALPPWDGGRHVRQLAVGYLGAADTRYSEAALKLMMSGAVARVYQPGTKFDITLILAGRQGLGKSTFLRRLAMSDSWFSDTLRDLGSKDAVEGLIGRWIIELGELQSIAATMGRGSGGMEQVKSFLTMTSDKVRLPYSRRSEEYLRQCVFAGTTNREKFLFDATGNRRFVILNVGVTEPEKSVFDDSFIIEARLAWAEVLHEWKAGTAKLTLTAELEAEAEELRAGAMSDNGTVGMILSYLEEQERVCILEIWQEALEEAGRPSRVQANEIGDIILNATGGQWEKMQVPYKFGKYGSQRGYQKRAAVGEQAL